eukprot:131035_1
MYVQVKSLFIEQVIDMLVKAEKLNRKEFIKHQNVKRFDEYAEKAKHKFSSQCIKATKAVWYHGINKDHGILTNQTMCMDHVIALICYSNCTELCTKFRETYRKKDNKETTLQQNNRHMVFGQMGKLLYQSFVFFASRTSRVQILYHGMSLKLLFPTLYCAFDAPTSTTTASSVAQTFCDDRGIVIKFESSDSSKMIRTLDMSLFTCFDHEEEHLIFETRLHIKDIWIPREKGWI